MGKKDKPKSNVNLLDLRPRRLVDHEMDGEGHVVILVPKYRGRLMGRLLQPRLKKPFFRITLDEVGSHVWGLCDGLTRVENIAESLRERFGEKVEPAENRLADFIRDLRHNRFIELGVLGSK